jgi:hypothetical protein
MGTNGTTAHSGRHPGRSSPIRSASPTHGLTVEYMVSWNSVGNKWNYSTLRQTPRKVFSNQECLANSWSNSSISGKLEFSWEKRILQHTQADTLGDLLQPGVPSQLMV